MKTVTYLLLASLVIAPNFVKAEETLSESANHAGNEVKQGTKKAKNRVKEATCSGTDLECKAKKAGHRVDEGTSKAGNKLEEKKDKKD